MITLFLFAKKEDNISFLLYKESLMDYPFFCGMAKKR